VPWQRLPTRDGDGDPPARVGQALDRLLHSLGAPRAGTVSTLFERWPEVVGAQIAAHTRPQAIDQGRLVLTVDDPAWATQLRYLEHDLLGRLAAAVGDGVVTGIDVRVKRR
jgi:predicted nucleic acid-binding Zn ribbon protein